MATASAAEESEEEKKEENGEKDANSKIKPYDEVIPEDAKSDAGLFFVHKVENKYYYELPTSTFGKPMLWVTQLAKTQAGHGYAGNPVGNRVVRWELRDESILLRDVRYTIRAEEEDPVRTAVEATSLEPIIAKFDIKAWGKDKAPVIEVTDFFLRDPPEFSAKNRLNAGGADRGRSFIEQIKSFQENIETKVLMTYKMKEGEHVVTVQLHHSMVVLPEDPMTPRREDDRVGFFSVSFEDYGTGEHQVERVKYITRWRLEKKDPEAEISEPKEPIVFYVGRGVPERWRKYVKQGIQAWQPAFESAGFKNAILAKEPPDPRTDPDWDAEDARYSVIRWLPSTIENAYGPHVHDPRTGEIIEADIRMYHNVMKLVRDWYFVQVSPLDERAQNLPLPDELMGELLAFVVSHEVGHSIGLPHNMKASSAYTVEQVRDPEFTRENGHVASIMDYGRFNYVAQPGDDVSLIPKIGPYDHFAIEWGYRQFPDAENEEEVRQRLEEIVNRQVENPVLRFGHPNPSLDPTAQTEDLTSNPVEATRLGFKNLERVAGFLVQATCEEGENYDLLENMYDELWKQRRREVGHVINTLGGVEFINLWYGQKDHRYELIGKQRQESALKFLVDQVFATPSKLIDPDITLRLQGQGVPNRVLEDQKQVLHGLIDPNRIQRMAEWYQRTPDTAFSPAQMLNELSLGLWSELEEERPAINLYRRNLQRAHVERLLQFGSKTQESSELSALARAELEELLEKLQGKEAKDKITRAHLRELAARIEKGLETED